MARKIRTTTWREGQRLKDESTSALEDGEDFDGQGQSTLRDLNHIGSESATIGRSLTESKACSVVIHQIDGGDWVADSEITVARNADFNPVLDSAIDHVNTINNGVIHLHHHGFIDGVGQFDITDRANFQLHGEGWSGTGLRRAAGESGSMFIWDGAAVDADQFGFTLKDIQIRGNKEISTGTTGSGIEVTNTTGQATANAGLRDVLLDHVMIRDFPGHGVATGDVWGWRLDTIMCEFNGQDGVVFQGRGSNPCIVNSKIIDNVGNNLNVRGVDEVKVANTELHRAGDDNIIVAQGADGGKLHGVTATGATNQGLRLSNAKNWEVVGGNYSDILYGGSSENCRFVDPDVKGAVYDNGGANPVWNGVIGGGPFGGVDLSVTAGQKQGDEAVDDGTNTPSGNPEKALWVDSDGDGTPESWQIVGTENLITP